MDKIITGLMIINILLISGCTAQSEQITCNKPYILVGTSCCLDQDDNSVCDSDEFENTSTTQTSTTEKQSIVSKVKETIIIQPYLTDEEIQEAIDYGREHKFDLSEVGFFGKYLFYTTKNSDAIGLTTPYAIIVNTAAEKARNYEDYTIKETKKLLDGGFTILLITYSTGDDLGFAENYKLIIKIEDEIYRPIESITDSFAMYDFDLKKRTASNTYSFKDLSILKNDKITIVVIKDKGEEEYTIDLTQIK